MHRAQNIAKRIGLIIAVMLLSGIRYVHAQNTSMAPYLGSWHKYRVPMDNVANTPTWQLQINGGAEIALANNMNEAGDGETWVRYSTEVDAGTNFAYVEIKFIDPRFDVADEATIIYSEMDAGSGNCVARRSIMPTVVENLFNLTLVDNGDACNSYSGISGWENGHGDISLYDLTTTVEFQVQLNKPGSLRVTEWQFSGTISLVSGSPNNTLTAPDIIIGGNANTQLFNDNGATWSVGAISGTSFTIDVTVANPDFSYDTDVLTFSVEVFGDITADYSVQLNLTGGSALTGTYYGSETEDSESGTPRQVATTVFGVPNTSIVSAF